MTMKLSLSIFFATAIVALAQPAPERSVPVTNASAISALFHAPQITVITNAAPPSPVSTQPASLDPEQIDIARMKAVAPMHVDLNRAPLGTVIRFLADNLKMDYLTLPEDPIMATQVSMSIKKNPYDILMGLTKTYGLDVTFRDGFWQFFTIDSGGLIQRTYQLRFISLGGVSHSSSTGGGSSSSSGGEPGMRSSLEKGGNPVFKVGSQELVQKITTLLGLSTTGTDATIAGASTVGDFSTLPTPTKSGLLAARAVDVKRNGTVVYDQDNNSLFVIATRQQHQLLEAYLTSVDRPQKQIYLETKFVLTSTNPRSQKGIETPFLSNGIGASASKDLEVDLEHPKLTTFPSAIISADDLSARLRFAQQTRDSMQVQYPTQTTLSGREVILRSVAQVPVVSSTSQMVSGAGNNNTSQVEFLDIGTTVNILPRVLDNNDILLNISITVSSITGTQEINGNPYPITSTQVYSNEVIVSSGYSLSMGGLESSLKNINAAKVPGLGDIPFFGFAFKNLSKDNSRTFLTLYVTPTLLDGYKGGNFEGPRHVTPAREKRIERKRFAGTSGSTVADVEDSMRGLDHEISELAQTTREGRGDVAVRLEAQKLSNELNLMDITLREAALHGDDQSVLRKTIGGYFTRVLNILKDTPKTSAMR